MFFISTQGVTQTARAQTRPHDRGCHHSPLELLDSLAVDGDGNVCVATLVTGAISVISPEGELLDQVHVPKWDAYVTNICFGGPDLKTAYVTSSGWGLLYEMPWERPGLRLNYQ